MAMPTIMLMMPTISPAVVIDNISYLLFCAYIALLGQQCRLNLVMDIVTGLPVFINNCWNIKVSSFGKMLNSYGKILDKTCKEVFNYGVKDSVL